MNTEARDPHFSRRRLVWPALILLLVSLCTISLLGLWNYKSQLESALLREQVLKGQLAAVEEQKNKLNTELNNHKDRLTSAEQREQTLTTQVNDLETQIATLQSALEPFKDAIPLRPLYPHQVEELKQKGLADPIQDIVADLMQHNELIPYEGVLGGTMCLCYPDAIHVLNSRWVLAYFEDGHIAGRMLLEYEVSAGGQITWKVLAATRE